MTGLDAVVDKYWYLPVFAVLNPNKPGKVRQVWDEAEKFDLFMTIYDPIGLIGFYAKVILQEIWRAGYNWHEPIPDDPFAKWPRWLKLIPKIENLKITRSYTRIEFGESPNIEVHTFVDARESSYDAVYYLRYFHGNAIDCMTIASKTRVAPLKLL